MADPDIDHAARLLRQIREHPEEADVRGASGREVMATRYSRSQFTDRVIGALTADGVGFAEASSTRSLPTLLDGLAFDEGLIR